MPSSRPKPDCLKPPKGVCTRTDEFEFTESTPVVERAGHAQRSRAVPRPDRPGKAVRRVVRDPDRVCLVLEGNHGRDGPEHLLTRYSIVVRRLHDRAREPESSALGSIAAEGGLPVHEGCDRLAVLGADERAHLGGFVRGVSDLDVPCCVDQRVQEAVVDRPLDEDPRARTAVRPALSKTA